MIKSIRGFNRPVWSWALYDWANSAFSTTVVTALFPIFFKNYWSKGADVSTSTIQLGTAHSAVNALLALFSPIVGALADRSSGKKKILFLFSFMGVFATAALAMVVEGDWQSAILLFIIGNIGFTAGNSMYDSLLISVAPRNQMEKISAFGFALGYLGGGLLFLVNVAMILKPDIFGFADKVSAIRFSFLSVAIWWAVFAIPLLLWVPEHGLGVERDEASRQPLGRAVKLAFTQLWATFKSLRQYENLGLFLLAYFFYIDGVNTIIKMSVDYSIAIGLKPESSILAILLVQFVGVPFTLAFGWLAERIGPKKSLFVCIGVYIFGTIWAYFMTVEWEFFFLAFLIGCVQGGVQSISRAVFARMVPIGQAGEFFGFYNMLGKFAAILGPLLIAFTSWLTHDPRASILSVIMLFIVGAALLVKVKIVEAKT